MATNIFQMLVDILKINQNLVSEYASQGPLSQMFYLFVFPTIFLVVFVYILTSRWMGEHRGLKILISVAVYAFIILQGYYSFFVMFSKYWLFGLLILGGLWMVFRPGRGGGGGGAAHPKALGRVGAVERIGERIRKEISGEEQRRVDLIKNHINQLRNMQPGTHAYGEMYFDTEKELQLLEKDVRDTDITGIGSTKFGGKEYEKLWKEFLNLHKPSKDWLKS